MSLKHFVRDAWLSASYYSGISRLYNALAGRKRGIISYHNVLPVNCLPAFDTYNVDVTAAIFDKQLQFLKNHFELLPIEQLSNPPSKGFFLTVDDGMLNNHEILAPILQKHDLTALFAICPDMVEGRRPYIWRDHIFLLLRQAIGKKVWLPMPVKTQALDGSIHFIDNQNINTLTRSIKCYVIDNKIVDVYKMIDDICENNGWNNQKIADADSLRYDFMNWQHIRTLLQNNHRIASHTLSHRILRLLPTAEKIKELKESKKILEQQFGTTIETLVYPYGGMAEIDHETVQIAKEVGYKNALMNVQYHDLLPLSHSLPRFALPPVSNHSHLYSIASGYKFLNKKMLPF